MPAKSEAQRELMAIAKYHPGKVYKRNRAVLKMSKKQLGDFARTKEPLPKKLKHGSHYKTNGCTFHEVSNV